MEREILILALASLLYVAQFVRLFRRKKFGGVAVSMLLVLACQQYDEMSGKIVISYTLVMEIVLLFRSIYNSNSFKEWKENQMR